MPSHEDPQQKLIDSFVQTYQLSPKDVAIARLGAELAVKNVTDEFYKGVGRTVVQRIYILIGAFVVGFGIARGWINFPGVEK